MIENKPLVKLLSCAPIWVAILAIRKCWASESKSDSYFALPSSTLATVSLENYSASEAKGRFILGPKDAALVKKIVKEGHTSTVEHLYYSFEFSDISRGLLQELARHRIASLSVQSTRYALKKLMSRSVDLREMFVSSGDSRVDEIVLEQLESIRDLILSGYEVTNDKLKYALPEAFKTTLVWTCNARSLRNFFRVRTSTRAHFEIRGLAQAIYLSLPQDHRFIFADSIQ